MYPLFRFTLLVFVFSSLSCDTGNLMFVSDLPNQLEEVSGMDYNDSGVIWMHNDSNNKSELYGFDSTGKLHSEIDIESKNRDWEDLAYDIDGNLYIGEFGNNMNERKNLAVLKIVKEDLFNGAEVKPARIKFKYEDQLKFPPDEERFFFDCEALIIKDSMVYVFTKSHIRDRAGVTSLYKFPAKEGSHIARKISSFEGCKDKDCKITAADYNFNTDQLVLLTHKSVLVFSDFDGDDFFSGEMVELPFNHLSQKEAVCFKNDSTLFITDERSGMHGGNLYEFKLEPKP